MGGKAFQHSSGIGPKSPYSLRLTLSRSLTTKPLILEKKRYRALHISPHATNFLHTRLSFSDCSSWVSRPDTKFLLNAHQIENRSSSFEAGYYIAFKHCISFATDLDANFGCDRFRITPDLVSKLLRAAIWSRCAVWFESEQTPFPQTGRQFRPAALHRIRLGTCCFVPMYSETNDW